MTNRTAKLRPKPVVDRTCPDCGATGNFPELTTRDAAITLTCPECGRQWSVRAGIDTVSYRPAKLNNH